MGEVLMPVGAYCGVNSQYVCECNGCSVFRLPTCAETVTRYFISINILLD